MDWKTEFLSEKLVMEAIKNEVKHLQSSEVPLGHIFQFMKAFEPEIIRYSMDPNVIERRFYFFAKKNEGMLNTTEIDCSVEAILKRTSSMVASIEASKLRDQQIALYDGVESASAKLLRSLEVLSETIPSTISAQEVTDMYEALGVVAAGLDAPANEVPEEMTRAISLLSGLLDGYVLPAHVFDEATSKFFEKEFPQMIGDYERVAVDSWKRNLRLVESNFIRAKKNSPDEILIQAHNTRTELTLHCLHHMRQIIVALETIERERVRPDTDQNSSSFQMPPAQMFGVSPEGAEHWVCEALRSLGYLDAEVTRFSNDGGIDIFSKTLVVSVKHYAGTVPVEEVRELYGVAALEAKPASLWTSGSVSVSGIEFADRARLSLVHYDVKTAKIEGINEFGRTLLAAHGREV